MVCRKEKTRRQREGASWGLSNSRVVHKAIRSVARKHLVKAFAPQYPLFVGILNKVHKGLISSRPLSDISTKRGKDSGLLCWCGSDKLGRTKRIRDTIVRVVLPDPDEKRERK